jgi:hypothetical protein
MSNRASRVTNSLPILRITKTTLIAVCFWTFLVGQLVGAEIVEELVDYEYPVNPDATLTIRNPAGAIRVYGGNVSQITITAVKRAFTADRLKQIAVEIRAAPTAVEIQTKIPPQKRSFNLEDRSGTVEYTMVVPNTIRITQLDLTSGEISIEGLRGGSVTSRINGGFLVARNSFSDMDLTIQDGRLQVIYDFWEPSSFQTKLTSQEADVRICFPPEASVKIVARTASGRILNWLGKEEIDLQEPVRALDFTVGSMPAAKFDMSSATGDIRLNKAY